MAKCNECGQEIREETRIRKNEFTIAMTDEMKDRCFLMQQNEACDDWTQKFLQSLRGRSYITEKQFAVYERSYKKILGTAAPATAPSLGF